MIIIIHGGGLIRQVLPYCVAKTFMGNPVCRISTGGHKPPGDFMFALGAGLEILKLMLDAVVDSRVITDFKMKAVVVPVAAPVSAIKGIVAFEADGAGNNPVFMTGKYCTQSM